MIQRVLSHTLTHTFFLFGARGTGKTTLLKSSLAANRPLVIDLLKRDIYRELQANPEKLSAIIASVKGTKRFVLIDEVQKVPELLDLVHHHIEEDKILFALTGSSSRKLKRGGANLLAGRAFVYKLYPLDFF
jgi:predicted AAA+ superfamily ATPase